MRVSRIPLALLVVAGVAAAGAFAYEVARPRVDPAKVADAHRNGVSLDQNAGEAPTPPPQTKDGRLELFGPAYAVDGDTILVQGVRADLWTIQAPKLDQTCIGADGNPWACGKASRSHLDKLIAGRQVACRPEGPPSDKDDWQGLCFVADKPCSDASAPCQSDLTSLNLKMVREGWAADFEGQYMDPEEDARKEKLGLWNSPVDWQGEPSN